MESANVNLAAHLKRDDRLRVWQWRCSDGALLHATELEGGMSASVGTSIIAFPCIEVERRAILPAGEVPDGFAVPGKPLEMSLQLDLSLRLEWGRSCQEEDSDYEIYAGTLGQYDSHHASMCTTGGATTANLGRVEGDAYFLVVPRSVNREGSYGRRGDGARITRPADACLEQLLAGCASGP